MLNIELTHINKGMVKCYLYIYSSDFYRIPQKPVVINDNLLKSQ